MDRVRAWMESRSTSMPEDIQYGASFSFRPPPPLRTTRTYDDDDAFNNVALNLLSRHGALELSVSETIQATLVRRQDRASFLEGLQHRKSRVTHLSPNTATLVEEVDRIFGMELRRLVETENASMSSIQRQELQNNQGNNRCSSSNSGAFSKSQEEVLQNSQNNRGSKKTRKFFPDGGDSSSGFFRSRRVQNIDWKLVEAISQVQSLRLDGGPTASSDGHSSFSSEYEPPTMSY